MPLNNGLYFSGICYLHDFTVCTSVRERTNVFVFGHKEILKSCTYI